MLKSLNQPLSEKELTDFGILLHEIPDAMTLEYLDGYLCSLVCSPKFIMPSQYINKIVGDYEFEDQEQLGFVTVSILKLWNTINEHLISGSIYLTIVTEYIDDNNEANYLGYEWAMGFCEGMKEDKDCWNLLIKDEDENELLEPIVFLAKEFIDMNTISCQRMPQDKKIEFVNQIQFNLPEIYRYFSKQRKEITNLELGTTQSRKTNKIGRNELCPCGSKKKYKHCCGRN